jgi:hypothetical protein
VGRRDEEEKGLRNGMSREEGENVSLGVGDEKERRYERKRQSFSTSGQSRLRMNYFWHRRTPQESGGCQVVEVRKRRGFSARRGAWYLDRGACWREMGCGISRELVNRPLKTAIKPAENSSLLTVSLTEIPPQNTSRFKTRFFASHHDYKMRDKYLKLLRIDKAVATLRRGDFVHYSNVAIKYKCDRGALSRRIRGLTKSKKQADSFWR